MKIFYLIIFFAIFILISCERSRESLSFQIMVKEMEVNTIKTESYDMKNYILPEDISYILISEREILKMKNELTEVEKKNIVLW